jgi:hypothetical protein
MCACYILGKLSLSLGWWVLLQCWAMGWWGPCGGWTKAILPPSPGPWSGTTCVCGWEEALRCRAMHVFLRGLKCSRGSGRDLAADSVPWIAITWQLQSQRVLPCKLAPSLSGCTPGSQFPSAVHWGWSLWPPERSDEVDMIMTETQSN